MIYVFRLGSIQNEFDKFLLNDNHGSMVFSCFKNGFCYARVVGEPLIGTKAFACNFWNVGHFGIRKSL